MNEGVADMIKYLANEPSVGLFFVQQHTQNAVPNLLHVKVKERFSPNFEIFAIPIGMFPFCYNIRIGCVLGEIQERGHKKEFCFFGY